jgi:hypothetical protein
LGCSDGLRRRCGCWRNGGRDFDLSGLGRDHRYVLLGRRLLAEQRESGDPARRGNSDAGDQARQH